MAQAQTAGEDDWSAIFVLYLLGPTLDGTVGIGPVGGDVDMSAGDVFSALDRAFLGIYAGEGERWGVVADLVYKRGHRLSTKEPPFSFGGAQLVYRMDNGLYCAASDHRKDGQAVGY